MLSALALAAMLPAMAADWPDLQEAPTGTREGKNDAAVVIAIQDYLLVDDIPGANANADAWYAWLHRSRGIPLDRIEQLRDHDASVRRIREAIATGAASVQAGGTLWFVFIGHGAPSRDGSDGLIVGAKADRSANGIYDESLARSEIVQALQASRASQAVAVIDACFSGQSTQGTALVPGLQPLIPTALLLGVPDKVTVLTAAGSGEFAGPLPGMARPAFSYLALGALRGWADQEGDGDGSVSSEEVIAYTRGALKATVRGRTQTPARLGQDRRLGRALTHDAPDLLALGAAARPTLSSTSGATVELGGGSSNLAQLAADAAAKAAERTRMERESADADARLQAARRASLDRAVAAVREGAARDFAALAPLLTSSAVAPEARPVLEAFIARYESASVSVDDVRQRVEVAELARVREALTRISAAKPPAPASKSAPVAKSVATSAPVTWVPGARGRITEVGAGDAYHGDSARLVGQTCVVGDAPLEARGAYWGGQTHCEDGEDYYFYQVGLAAERGPEVARAAPVTLVGTPDGWPVGSSVRIRALHEGDAYVNRAAEIVGDTCTVADAPLSGDGDGWWSGQLTCTRGGYYFYKVAVEAAVEVAVEPAQNAEPRATSAAGLDAEVATAVASYYDARGPFAGTYRLTGALRTRVRDCAPQRVGTTSLLKTDPACEAGDTLVADIQYGFEGARAADAGEDARRFHLRRDTRGNLAVTKMEGRLSGDVGGLDGTETARPGSPAWLEEVRRHYRDQGEWKGKFHITKILASRLEESSPRLRVVHVRYRYAAVKGTETGEDTRTFRFEKQADGGWTCTAMGTHASGNVP